MPRAQQRLRARRARHWDEAVTRIIAEVREHIGLAADERIPDAVLRLEVRPLGPKVPRPGERYVAPDLGPVEQWIGHRLLGFGNGTGERAWLRDLVADVHRSPPWSLLIGGPARRPIGSAPPRRKRVQPKNP
ncbi:MAG: hypothetical protein ACRDLL_04440 [Solirubrobacterales bacterium]